SGPPPWPAPVLDDIGRRQHEIAALLAALPPLTPAAAEPAPPLSQRLTAARAATKEFGRRAVVSTRGRWRSASVRARIGTALGVVALLLAVVGITAFATREQPPVTG